MRVHGAAGAVVASILALVPASGARAQAVTPAFTYQGELRSGGAPVTTPVDVRYRLFDAAVGGSQIGGTLQSPGLTPAEGRIAVSLDFGAGAFTGQRRWLAIEAAPAGTGQYVALTPRQELAATPFANYAANIPAQYATFTSQGGSAVFTSGDVGIGTSSPSAGLHVSRVGPGGLAMNVNDRLYVSDSSAFVGINRTARVTGAETFGLQNTATQTTYTGMYIRSSFTTGLPFYGYATPGATGWTQLDNTGAWSLYLGGVPRLFTTAAGSVGIGTTTPAALLDVAGTARASAFEFPDGSRLTRAPLESWQLGAASGLPTTARYRVILNGVAIAGATISGVPRVDQPVDGAGIPAGSKRLAAPIVLRRPASVGSVWYTNFSNNAAWGTLIVELTQTGVPGSSPRVEWNFGAVRGYTWNMRVADDGLPVEEVSFWFAPASVTRTRTGTFTAGLPGAGARIGVPSGYPAGTTWRPRIDGTVLAGVIVSEDLQLTAPIDVASGQRTGRVGSPVAKLRANAGDASILYTRWAQTQLLNLDLVTVSAANAQSLMYSGPTGIVKTWRLVPTDDGALVEDYEVVLPIETP